MRFLIPGPALPALPCTTGCTGPDGSTPSPSPTPTSASASASASPQPVSDADLCTRLVTYWARRTLADDTYGDYQSMGLPHGQYRILLDVVAAGRSVRQRQGADVARRLMDRQARTACAARYRHGTPSTGPWT
ncbi:hypothetical protein GCM10010300_29300 [Streptomyces olivaceoviridis]|uniref:hypothetical protein n=1 Tax=Streptomyces olivaceoviridis TaxID=1921 RepID=UPI0019CA5E04|nr:hypothetical protein [Streptomyces olivaceoviridis]GGY83424.1 hypothetical protein GCM10010300_29300 [Streptomyces olivaceoviridis]